MITPAMRRLLGGPFSLKDKADGPSGCVHPLSRQDVGPYKRLAVSQKAAETDPPRGPELESSVKGHRKSGLCVG